MDPLPERAFFYLFFPYHIKTVKNLSQPTGTIFLKHFCFHSSSQASVREWFYVSHTKLMLSSDFNGPVAREGFFDAYIFFIFPKSLHCDQLVGSLSFCASVLLPVLAGPIVFVTTQEQAKPPNVRFSMRTFCFLTYFTFFTLSYHERGIRPRTLRPVSDFTTQFCLHNKNVA